MSIVKYGTDKKAFADNGIIKVTITKVDGKYSLKGVPQSYSVFINQGMSLGLNLAECAELILSVFRPLFAHNNIPNYKNDELHQVLSDGSVIGYTEDAYDFDIAY